MQLPDHFTRYDADEANIAIKGTELTVYDLHSGGPPNGGFKLTSENHEEHFAIQVLGRFGLAYLLAESGTLKDTWVTICAPTGKNGSAPNLDDLELKSEKERNKWVVGRIMATGSNDGAVTDGVVSVSLRISTGSASELTPVESAAALFDCVPSPPSGPSFPRLRSNVSAHLWIESRAEVSPDCSFHIHALTLLPRDDLPCAPYHTSI